MSTKIRKRQITKSKLSFRLIIEYPDPKMSLDEKFVSLKCTISDLEQLKLCALDRYNQVRFLAKWKI